jgi:hypothetical protein
VLAKIMTEIGLCYDGIFEEETFALQMMCSTRHQWCRGKECLGVIESLCFPQK